MIPEWLRNLVVLVVLGAWASSYAAQYFIADWVFDPQLHVLMIAVVGGVFAGNVIGGNKNHPPPPPDRHRDDGGEQP